MLRVLFLLIFFNISSSFAYNSLTHVQLLESAISYLQPESLPWLNTVGFKKLMTRAIVDADYETDIWLSSPLLSEAYAASTFGILNPFSTILHHINTKNAGKIWEYDGFSYQGSSKRGRDLFMALPTIQLVSKLSPPFGGTSPLKRVYSDEVGSYQKSFTNPELSQLIFPPAYIPAQLAYEKFLSSSKATHSSEVEWDSQIPAINLSGASKVYRHYAKSELAGLPRSLDLLGLTLHLAQDMGIPQHTQSTVDTCHTELELFFDEMGCKAVEISKKELIDQTHFVEGTYDQDHWQIPVCQKLYDPQLVKHDLETIPFLVNQKFNTANFVLNAALYTAHWRFVKKPFTKFHSIYQMGSELEDLAASSCKQFFSNPELKKKMLAHVIAQYNFSVAVTVRLLKTASTEYALTHF